MKCSIITLLLILALAVSIAPAQEADEAPAPAEKPEVSQTPFAKVVSTSGPAEYATARPEGEPDWKKLEANLELPATALIRTGFRAKVVLEFSDGSKVEIRRGTMVGLRRLAQGPEKQEGTTQIGVKYGTIRAEVAKKQTAQNVEVSTPVASLTVGGSEATISYSVDKCMTIQAEEGTWRVKRGCRSRKITAGDETDCSLTPGIVLKLYRRDSYMGGPLGLTDTERYVDVFRGTGRGWVGIPGSQWTVSGTPPGRLTDKNEPSELDIVNP
jgi:hypothetical protein